MPPPWECPAAPDGDPLGPTRLQRQLVSKSGVGSLWTPRSVLCAPFSATLASSLQLYPERQNIKHTMPRSHVNTELGPAWVCQLPECFLLFLTQQQAEESDMLPKPVTGAFPPHCTQLPCGITLHSQHTGSLTSFTGELLHTAASPRFSAKRTPG